MSSYPTLLGHTNVVVTSGASDLDFGRLNVANLNVGGVIICPDDILMGKLLGLYLRGKDLDLDREDYLNIILKLSYVGGNSLMAIDVFERLKKIKKLCL